MTTTLYLIRHGYTLWNEEGRIQGHLNSNLNETGKSQAVHLANRNHWHEVDALYSSDLQRALQTMSPIAKRIGLTITEDARLRERCMGVLEGNTKAENQAKYPHAWTDYIARAPNTHPEGGETIEEVLGRALNFIKETTHAHPEQTVACVTHGGWLRILLKHVLGIPLEQPTRFLIRNTSVHRLLAKDDRLYVENIGDLSHIPPPLWHLTTQSGWSAV